MGDVALENYSLGGNVEDMFDGGQSQTTTVLITGRMLTLEYFSEKRACLYGFRVRVLGGMDQFNVASVHTCM